MADNTLVVKTSAQVTGTATPAMSQSNSASYVSGQTINQTLVLRAGQQYAPNIGFSNLVIETTGPVQLLATRGSNPSFLNLTISQQTTLDQSVDSFTITNNGTASVTVRMLITVYIGNPLPSTGVVTSLDGMTGDIRIVAGSGIGIADAAQTITVTNNGVLTVNGQSGNVTLNANNLPGLAQVAISGEYSDLKNVPSPYVLPIASTTTLGGVKVGTGLSITQDGTLSAAGFPANYVTSVNTLHGDVTIRASDNGANNSASLIVNDGSTTGDIVLNRLAVSGPNLTMMTQNGVVILGTNSVIATVDGQAPDANGNIVVKATDNVGTGNSLIKNSGETTGNIVLNKLIAGSNVQISPDENGNLTISNTINPYTLPVATASVLGGVKKGANVNIASDGTLSVAAPYVLPPATRTVLGGVAIGNNINVDSNGVISVANPYTLPVSTSTVLGGVKIGANVNVTSDGTISVAAPYSLPVATSSVLGGVKQGSNVTIAGDGTLSVAAPYVLPVATTTVLGGVKQGSNVTIAADGTLSATPYQLPIASASTLGGIRVGNLLSIDPATGILSAANQAYTLPPATTTTLGGVIVGNNLSVDGTGKISGPAPYVLPAATTTTLGGVKAGSGLTVQADGTLSANFSNLPVATATTLGGVKIGANVTVQGDGTISVAAPYSLPTASASVLGGIKVGANLSIDGSGVLSASTSYTLPVATSSVLGGVKIGANVSVAGDGTISVAAPYTLPAATTSTLGGLIVGDNLTVDANGRVSANAGYTLPPATTTTLGGVKVGSGLTVDGTGLLALNYSSPVTSVNNQTGAVSIRIQDDQLEGGAGTTLIGSNGAATGVMTLKRLIPGSGITITPTALQNLTISSTSPVTSVSGQTGAVVIQASDNNTSSGVSLISNSGASTGNIKLLRLVAGTNITLGPDGNGNLQINGPSAYTLTPATASTLGGVKIGANVNVAGDGTISVAAPTAPYTLPPATTSTLGGVIVGTGLVVDGTGKISVSSPTVTSVNGQTGAVIVSATNAVTGNISLITDSGATTGVMKFKQLKAGSNVTITDDGAGTLTVNSTATSGFSTVADVSSSRATNTNYTATGATLICVTATVSAGGILTAKVNGVTVGTIQVPSGGPTITIPISFMAPNGNTYSITPNNNSLVTILTWTETS